MFKIKCKYLKDLFTQYLNNFHTLGYISMVKIVLSSGKSAQIDVIN